MAVSWSIVSLPQGTSLVSWDIRSAEKEVTQNLTYTMLTPDSTCFENCRSKSAGLNSLYIWETPKWVLLKTV